MYLFGPGVAKPVLERFDEVPVADTMDFYDWRVQGIRLQIQEPLVSAQVAFKSDRINIDCRFDALHPGYAFSSHKDGCPRYFADDRIEQHGRLSGNLELDGRSIAFDTVGQRDHSWGSRIWGLNQHYKWFHATSATAAVHFFEFQSLGKVRLRGFVLKQGRLSAVTAIDYEYVLDADMNHTAIEVQLTDAAGRTTCVKSTAFACHRFDADPMVMNHESALTATIDGEPGVGWCEFSWNRNYLEFAKPYANRYTSGS
jgi:hypothetical protein